MWDRQDLITLLAFRPLWDTITFALWEPSMITSHMLRTSITDQRNNTKTLHSLLGSTRNSTILQVFVAMKQHFNSNAYVQQYRSAVAMIRLSKQRATENCVSDLGLYKPNRRHYRWEDRKFQTATLRQEIISDRKSHKGDRYQDILTSTSSQRGDKKCVWCHKRKCSDVWCGLN
jgi:hypothetical protein